MNLHYKIVFLLLLCLESCNQHNKHDSFQIFSTEQNSVILADRLKIEKSGSTTLLTILNPWQGAENVNHFYYLVKRGDPIPQGIDSSEVIFVPLRKIICMSTTHIAMISALNEEASIRGVSGTDFIYSETVLKNVGKGFIEDVGYEANLNKEMILKISPDLIMMYGIGSESAGYVGKLKEFGIKVLFNADYLETEPMRKAEWIKLFGALYCKEFMADSIFRSELNSYDSLKSYISENISERPKVMLGLPYKDTWYISPGNSFTSVLINDAGGEYLWNDTESSVSMPYGLENVYLRALKAEYWLNIGAVNSKMEISAVDKRLSELPVFIHGNLFNYNNRITIRGGNDYWESGSLYPHLILKDIASILHPELFARHKLLYYKKID